MSIEAVGAPVVQNERTNKGKTIGAISGAAVGAAGGYGYISHLTKGLIPDSFEKFEAEQKKTFIDGCKACGLTSEEIEQQWISEKDKILSGAKKSIEETKNVLKKAKRKWAIGGALVLSLLGLGIGALCDKKHNKNIQA